VRCCPRRNSGRHAAGKEKDDVLRESGKFFLRGVRKERWMRRGAMGGRGGWVAASPKKRVFVSEGERGL